MKKKRLLFCISIEKIIINPNFNWELHQMIDMNFILESCKEDSSNVGVLFCKSLEWGLSQNTSQREQKHNSTVEFFSFVADWLSSAFSSSWEDTGKQTARKSCFRKGSQCPARADREANWDIVCSMVEFWYLADIGPKNFIVNRNPY